MLDNNDHFEDGATIKVIGVGGGGGNAVNYMANQNIKGVVFLNANTDAQALKRGDAMPLQIGSQITKGLGAGTNPEIGKGAALEDREAIVKSLEGTDMLFITTGMGGGTGTGATPVIAEIAREMGILTVAVVTRPFPFEGKRRAKLADEGIKQLANLVDSLITIPNEKLLTLLGKDVSLLQAFAKADDVLCSAVRGISDIIKRPGHINVDFADVRAVMSQNGMALMGTGIAAGPNRAREAAELAIRNPLLSGVNLRGARGILVSISTGPDLTLGEYQEVGEIIEEYASDEAIVKVGTVVDPNMRDEMQVTVVATGLDSADQARELAHGQNSHVQSSRTSNMGSHGVTQHANHMRSVEQYHDKGHNGVHHSERDRRDFAPQSGYEAPQPVAAFSEPQHEYRTADQRMSHQEIRRQPVVGYREASKVAMGGDQNLDYLDIPAFIRRDSDRR